MHTLRSGFLIVASLIQPYAEIFLGLVRSPPHNGTSFALSGSENTRRPAPTQNLRRLAALQAARPIPQWRKMQRSEILLLAKSYCLCCPCEVEGTSWANVH